MPPSPKISVSSELTPILRFSTNLETPPLIGSVNSLVTGAVQPVIAGYFAKTHREDANLPEAYLLALSYACMFAWPAFIIIALLAHPLIELMFGAIWLPAVPIAQVLCAGAAIGLVGMLAQTLLRSTGAVQQNFYIQVVSVPIFIACVALGSQISLTYAAQGAVVSGTIVSGFSIVILKRRIDLSLRDLAKILWPPFAASCLTAVPVVIVVNVLGPSPLSLVFGPILALLVWLACLKIFHHPVRHEVELILGYIYRRLRNRN